MCKNSTPEEGYQMWIKARALNTMNAPAQFEVNPKDGFYEDARDSVTERDRQKDGQCHSFVTFQLHWRWTIDKTYTARWCHAMQRDIAMRLGFDAGRTRCSWSHV